MSHSFDLFVVFVYIWWMVVYEPPLRTFFVKRDAAVAASLIGWFETTILFPLKTYGAFCPEGENFAPEDSHHLKEKVVFRILVIEIIG